VFKNLAKSSPVVNGMVKE